MFKCEFSTENAAFHEDDLHGVVASILENIGEQINKRSRTYGLIRDYNGNTVGNWTLEKSK